MRFCPECATELITKQQDQVERQVCPNPACQFIHWNNPTPVVAAIIERDGALLLVHNVQWPPKMLGLVSGFLEAKEDPAVAVEREVLEETQLRVTQSELVGVYPFEMLNQVIIAYGVSVEGEVQLNEELDDFRWIPSASVKTWEFGTGLALRDWLKTRGITD